MFRRLLRSAIVLAVLVAAYNAYALLAVPLMEPPLELAQQRRVDRGEQDHAAQSVTRYQLLLSNYFPKDHWSQTRPPKVIASATEQAMLVFDDFKRRAREGATSEQPSTTLVDIDRIALLIFPTPPREGLLPPRDAIVLEAPGGAHLQFDDFRPEIGRIGQILRGEFPGPIHIHSEMNQPTPEDDLFIKTADLHMNTKLMYTSAPVEFQMGQNRGGGTELEIRFLADEHVKPGDPGLKIAGVDSLEIRRDVKMRLELDTSRLLPGGKDADATAGREKKLSPYEAAPAVRVTDANAAAAAPPAKPPVEVSCSGPFTFDFVRHVASLDHDVELRQINPNGPSDQVMCARLDIHFAPKLLPGGATQPAAADAEDGQRSLGQLEPVAIVAEGHPVVVTSPEQHAQARGDRIQIALRDQRLRISGGSDAMLVFGANALQAPIIDYQHPARDEATAIGRFRATGPGSLRYVIDEKKPSEVLQAQWQTSVQLGREKGQPVLALDGRPKISFAASGTLSADQIRMYLRELEGKGTEGLAISGNKKGDAETTLRLAPDRLLATGRVEIASPQFTGRTQQLSTVFRIADAELEQNKSEKDGAAGSTNLLNPGSGQPTQTYYIDSDQMRLEVLLKEQSAVPSTLECAGHIVLREAPLSPTNQQPLEIRGAQLTATQLDTNSPHITLRGNLPGQVAGAAKALLAGRGMTMQVDTIEADGGDGRVWSDGPGKATLLVARNLQGQAAASPMPLEVTWQNGFRFDGQAVIFRDNIVVTGMDSTLHCDQLAAKLASKVQLDQQLNQANMNMSEIEASGRVTIENVTRDAGGLTSRALMQLATLKINQQTGAISGTGPGVIRATRFGTGMDLIPGQLGAARPTALASNAAGAKLHFLRVDFHSGLDGNMYTRELTFHNRIRTVYGPVDSWEQELDLARPETLTPDTMTLTCDELRLNEDPLAARATAAAPSTADKRPVGAIQMQASGNVRIAGQIPSHGEFTVQADRASYEEMKDAFILEGDTRTPAKLWRRNATGQNSPPLEARKIRYSRATNEAKVDGIQFLEITPQDLEHARRPEPPPK